MIELYLVCGNGHSVATSEAPVGVRVWSSGGGREGSPHRPRARALLREGADILAKRRANGPTPLSIARDLIVRGAAPPGSTPRLIVQHNCKSLHRRWRVVARMVGRLVVMRKRSAERLYAPGGAGAEASRAEFERLSLD